MNLRKNLVNNMREKHKTWLARCDWCSWPLAGSAEDGCVPGNCSQRPRPRRDDSELREDFRALLAYIESDKDNDELRERLDSALRRLDAAEKHLEREHNDACELARQLRESNEERDALQSRLGRNDTSAGE